MKTLFILLIWIGISVQSQAFSGGRAYLDRFMAYSHWSQNLPQQPDDDFSYLH